MMNVEEIIRETTVPHAQPWKGLVTLSPGFRTLIITQISGIREGGGEADAGEEGIQVEPPRP
jgi:hypothetical protein